MKKIKELYANHKGLFIVSALALILFLIMLIMFISMFFGKFSNEYGDRLDGIDNVEISDDKLNDIANTIKEDDNVEDCSLRIQGKIVYLNITFKEKTKLDTAKEIATKSLDNFEEDELEFYDFSFFLVENKDDGYVITGNKHPKIDSIGWVNS